MHPFFRLAITLADQARTCEEDQRDFQRGSLLALFSPAAQVEILRSSDSPSPTEYLRSFLDDPITGLLPEDAAAQSNGHTFSIAAIKQYCAGVRGAICMFSRVEIKPTVVRNCLINVLAKDPWAIVIDPITLSPLNEPIILIDSAGVPISGAFIDRATFATHRDEINQRFPLAASFVKDYKTTQFLEEREKMFKELQASYRPAAVEEGAAAALPEGKEEEDISLTHAKQLIELNQPHKAKDILEHLLSLGKFSEQTLLQQFETHYWLGMICYQFSDFERSTRGLEIAFKLFKDTPALSPVLFYKAWLKWGDSLRAESKWDEAMACYESLRRALSSSGLLDRGVNLDTIQLKCIYHTALEGSAYAEKKKTGKGYGRDGEGASPYQIISSRLVSEADKDFQTINWDLFEGSADEQCLSKSYMYLMLAKAHFLDKEYQKAYANIIGACNQIKTIRQLPRNLATKEHLEKVSLQFSILATELINSRTGKHGNFIDSVYKCDCLDEFLDSAAYWLCVEEGLKPSMEWSYGAYKYETAPETKALLTRLKNEYEGVLQASLQSLDVALTNNPFHRTLLIAKGQTLFYLGRYSEAAITFARSLRIAPNDPKGTQGYVKAKVRSMPVESWRACVPGAIAFQNELVYGIIPNLFKRNTPPVDKEELDIIKGYVSRYCWSNKKFIEQLNNMCSQLLAASANTRAGKQPSLEKTLSDIDNLRYQNLIEQAKKIIGANINWTPFLDSLTKHKYNQALRRACSVGSLDLVKILIAYCDYTKDMKLNYNEPSSDNLNALDLAMNARPKNNELCNLLIVKGAISLQNVKPSSHCPSPRP